jgi:hypothetical protein
MQRPLFICEAIKDCKEKSNCCPHKTPHIKDERCVPKVCRYGPANKEIDCVSVDKKQEPVEKPVETPLEPIKETEPDTVHLNADVVSREGKTITEVKLKSVTLEESPEKKPEPAQRPVTVRKKPGRKASK